MKTSRFLTEEYNLASKETKTITLHQDSKQIAGYFLRAMRGRAELSEAINSDVVSKNFVTHLEQIRIALRKNELEKAIDIIISTPAQNKSEECELTLEKCRYFLFKKEWQNVIDHSSVIIGNADIPVQSRMTFLQIRGLAFTQLGNYEQAIHELELSISISHILPKASSGFIAYTVLAQTYCYQGDRENAQKILNLVDKILDQTENVDEWVEKKVQYLRAKFHFAKNFLGREECQSLLTESLCVSEWLGLETTKALCKEDFSKMGLQPNDAVRHFVTWSYFPRLKLILHHVSKTAVRIENSEVIYKILDILCEGPQKQADLFEKVWGMPYKESYSMHLRATLSKVRSKLPSKSLSVQNDIVSLL